MENFLEELEPNDLFPGKKFYKHKEDGYIYTDPMAGPKFWKKIGNNFQAREDDIYIASLSRTGSTWTAELVSLLASDLNYDRANTVPLRERCPTLNFDHTDPASYDIPSPRCILTHLAYDHLPSSIREKKCKIVYSLRNPKDTLASYYNFSLMNRSINFVGNFDDLFKTFIKDQLPAGSFGKNVSQYWKHRNEDNFFFLSFEERKKDFPSCVKKLAKFLGKDLTDDDVERLAAHCSFNAMKTNPKVNLEDNPKFDREKSDFIRKGEVGDWKNYFSEEQNLQMEEYVNKYFAGSGLEFSYE